MAARPASESYRERSGTSQEADTRPDRRPLTFSFWTAMFGKEYETLWQTTLHRSGHRPDGRVSGSEFVLMQPIYAWQRFWVPRDGSIDLSDGGFLSDPQSESARYSAYKLDTLSELQPFRALGLLGEPGIGKSATLQALSLIHI